ncbi:hypothetical protein CR513_29266, partial [Mucuna pruriens]
MEHQRTLVDLNLSVLASRGESSPSSVAIVVEDGIIESRPSSVYTQVRPSWILSVEIISSQSLPRATRQVLSESSKRLEKRTIINDPYLWRLCSDKVIRKCILETEIISVLQFCHSAPRGGHYGSTRTARKGLDFMGPFLVSNGYSYILLAIDHVSRWVEAIATRTNDAKVVVVAHKIATAYHPQTNGQSEVFNREIKQTLQKMTNPSKLRSIWDGPFVITNIFLHGAVQLKDEHTNSTFQVNGHQIKPFHEGPMPTINDMEIISLVEPAPPDGIA